LINKYEKGGGGGGGEKKRKKKKRRKKKDIQYLNINFLVLSTNICPSHFTNF